MDKEQLWKEYQDAIGARDTAVDRMHTAWDAYDKAKKSAFEADKAMREAGEAYQTVLFTQAVQS